MNDKNKKDGNDYNAMRKEVLETGSSLLNYKPIIQESINYDKDRKRIVEDLRLNIGLGVNVKVPIEDIEMSFKGPTGSA